jgi:hypothetical protein
MDSALVYDSDTGHPSLGFSMNRSYRLLPMWAILAVVAGFEPAHAGARPGGITLYRLEPGSTYAKGCIDPECVPMNEPIPLAGTFVMTKEVNAAPFGFVSYRIDDMSWRATSGAELRLRGNGRFTANDETVAYQSMGLELTELEPGLQVVALHGNVNGFAGLPHLDMTLTGSLGPYQDVAVVLKASPVPAEQVHWYKLIGGSEYTESGCRSHPVAVHPLIGTFGLLEPLPGSSGTEMVLIRWSAAPAAGAADPSRTFLTGSGSGDDEVVLGMSEDNRIFYPMRGALRDPDASVLELSLTGGCGQAIRLRAKQD